MKIKQATRYHLNEVIRPTAIYYTVMVLLFIVAWIISKLTSGNYEGSITSDSATVFFLFILGLNMFKAPFGMMRQNGISRRTQLLSIAIIALGLSLLMGVIDSLYPLFTGAMYETTYAVIYGVIGGQKASFSFLSLCWTITANLAAFTFGYFLTVLYYRMSKPLKIGVSVGIPLLLFVVMPMAEVFVPSFKGFTSLIKGIGWALGIDGFGQSVPQRAVGVFAAVSVAMVGLSYLLISGATLKEK